MSINAVKIYSYFFVLATLCLPLDVNLIGWGGVSALHLAARSTEIEKDAKSVYKIYRKRESDDQL
jgi:hypothetical protein